MAVVQPLWLWCGPYGRGMATMDVVQLLWLWCHCYGRVLALVGQFMTWLCCQQLQP